MNTHAPIVSPMSRPTRIALCSALLLVGCVSDPLDAEDFAVEEDEVTAPHERPSDAILGRTGADEAAPGFGLTITKNGADIELDWDPQGPGVGYGVLSCPRPYFTYDDPDVTVESPKTASTSYTLTGANDGTTRYYRIYTNDNRLSTTVGKMTVPLEPNFSVLPMCLQGDIDMSDDLLADLGSATAQALYSWDPVSQSWLIDPVAAPSPYGLELGRSVSIKHPAAGTPNPSDYTWVGTVPDTQEFSVALEVGENKVTTPLNMASGLMASDLLMLVPGGQRVGTWDNAALDYHWYPDDGDFAVAPCSSVRLDVDTPSTFPDCDPASLSLGAASDHNWYTGGVRDAEQGTHGVGMGDCPAGTAVVGVKAYEGGSSDWTDGIGVHCQEISIDQGALTFGADHYNNWYTGGPRSAEQGTHGGDPGTGECPAGMILAGLQYFEGGHSDWVDGIGLYCVELEWTGASFTHQSSAYINWYHGGTRDDEQGTHGIGPDECAPGQLVTGVQYFEGGDSDWVDGVGIRCRDLEFDNTCF